MKTQEVPPAVSVPGPAAPSDIHPLLRPRSVALVGASADAAKVSGKPLHNLRLNGFPGEIFAVNPKYRDLNGTPCFPSVLDLPEDIDCALILLPADKVLPALEGLCRRGAKSAIVMSGGFAEGGEAGRALQDRMIALSRKHGMRILGPNTLGAVNFHGRAALSFSLSFEAGDLSPGALGFVSQSGAMMAALANRAADRGLGLSYSVATGNEADLDTADFLTYFAEDESTRVVMALVEGIKDGRKFLHALEVLRRAAKPVVLLKVGKSEEGRRVTLAHTGKMAGSARVFDAACRKAGAVQADDPEELLDAAEVLLQERFPRKRTLGIITTSGGAAALLADAAEGSKISLPSPSPETVSRLTPLLPPFARQTLNPVDLTGQHLSQPEIFNRSVEEFLNDDAFGAVAVVMVPGAGQVARERAETLAELARNSPKPVLTCWIGGELSSPGREACRANGIPVMDSPRSLAGALSRLADYTEGSGNPTPEAESPPEDMRTAAEAMPAGDGPTLTEHESERWLASCGIPLLDNALASTADEALASARHLGFPVAMKALSPDIPHKNMAGLVRLNVENEPGVLETFSALSASLDRTPAARNVGILIEPMARDGVDLLIGSHNDPTFGPVVVFGWGGVHTEILDEVSLRLAPVSPEEAAEMLGEVRGFPDLAEVDLGGPVDWGPLRDVLVRVSHLAVLAGEKIESIDVNPIRVTARSGECFVLDASVVLK